MTVVVWDGETLATDRSASDGDAQWETVKAWYGHRCIMSGAGPLHTILAMREWYMAGADPEKLPPQQLTEQFCHFLVVDGLGLHRYEQGPVPIEHGFTPCAFGVGRDFALGALAMGASAFAAVGVANKHSVHCGLGVALYQLEENQDEG